MRGTARLVRSLFQAGEIDGFLAFKEVQGQAVPFLFTPNQPDELAFLCDPGSLPRYPMERILLAIARIHPQAKLGMLTRECDARGLNELVKGNQIHPDRVLSVPLACCQSDLSLPTPCSHLSGQDQDPQEKPLPPRGLGKNITFKQLSALAPDERFQRWQEEFAKCIKCYGCRNVCPVYICKECVLEDNELIPAGQIPPDFSFHLIRACHMAGYCIDCGLCEEACPAEIPLRFFYRGVNQIVEKTFGYKPGAEGECSPFHRIV